MARMFEDKNFRNGRLPPLKSEYDGFAFCYDQPIDNAGVMIPHRIIPGDDTPRVFRNCNLVNALPPPGSTLIDCNTSIIQTKQIKSSNTITIGQEVITNTEYKNIVHGRTDPTTLTPVYLAVPREDDY